MPKRGFLAPDKVKEAFARRTVTRQQIEQNATRIIRTILRSGVVDGPKTRNPALVNSAANRAIALRTAQEGIVLLKNERQLLPLDASKTRSIAVIGPAAREMQMGAAGSPGVTPLHSVGPLEGLKKRLGAGAQIRYASGDVTGINFPAGTFKVPDSDAAGFHAEYFAGKNLEGAPTATRTEAQIELDVAVTGTGSENYSARWTGIFTPRKSGATQFLFRVDDGCRLAWPE